MKLRFLIALWVGKLSAAAISLIAPGRGTNLPGQLALKIDPQLLRHFSHLELDRVIFVTGTNGKSTTTNLLAHTLKKAGYKLACNLEGANLLAGAAVTLLKDADLLGRLRSDYLLLETDERFLPIIHQQLPARHLCVTNLQKDQVQRNGEPDLILQKIASVVNPDMTLYLNSDDPISSSLAQKAGRCCYYGVAPHSASFRKTDFHAVSMPCPICGEGIEFATYNIDNIGPFTCPACGFGGRQADFCAEDVDFTNKTFRVKETVFPFGYSTPYFLYCYIAALAVAQSFGVADPMISAAFTDFVNIGGRMEDVQVAGKTIHYLRMKQENPETVQSALNVISSDQREKVFLLGLDELVDFHPHYTNTFYTFDCDWQQLIDSNVQGYLCFSGSVAYDAALRLVYAGADPAKITVLPTNDDQAIVERLLQYDCDNIYLITWLKKFMSLADYAKKHPGQPVTENKGNGGKANE